MRIMAIGAHYDDIELGCGGVLARFVQKKHHVHAIIITTSNYKYYDGKVMRTEIQAQKEGFNALHKLGIDTISNLQYATKEVPYNSEITEKLNQIIDKYAPDLIITHHLEDSHRDHYNTIKSVLGAGRNCKNIWMFEPLFSSNLSNKGFNPTLYVDISDTINIKIKSIKAHRSQYNRYGKGWINLIKARARVRGIEIQTNYAEAFEIIKQKYII